MHAHIHYIMLVTNLLHTLKLLRRGTPINDIDSKSHKTKPKGSINILPII